MIENRNHKKLVTLIIALALVLSASGWGKMPAAAAADNFLQVKVNGQLLNCSVSPVLVNGITFVPLRSIFDALGAQTVWDADLNMVSAVKGNTKVSLRINHKIAWINNKEVPIDAAPIVVDGTTMVPARFIAQSLNQPVAWDAATRTVYIGSREPVATTPAEDQNYTKTVTLQADTTAAYSAGKTAVFKAGTVLNYRSKDYVESGTLKDSTLLSYADHDQTSALFQGGTVVTFNSNGYLSSGTLAHDTSIAYTQLKNVDLNLLPYKDRNCITFQAGTAVKFNDAGYATEGTPADDTSLQYNEKNTIQLKGENAVTLNDKGMATSGTLAGDAYLLYNSSEGATFKGGTAITFGDNGVVTSGTLEQDTDLPRTDYSTRVTFEKNTQIKFNNSGNVVMGILEDNTILPISEGTSISFMKDTEVDFNDQGYVSKGTLRGQTSLPIADGLSQNFPSGAVVTFDANGCAQTTATSD